MRPLRALAVTAAATVLPLSLVAAADGAEAAPPPAAGAASTVTAPGLTAPVRVVRTTDGVPHLAAASRHDLWFGQGWVHGTDRLFQMDTLRRTASGTLAELLGPGALRSDVQLRTLGLRRAAERSWAAATPRLRDAVTAYTEGVNAKLASGAALPAEYGALELTSVARWTPVDTIVIGKLLSFQLSFDLDADVTAELQAYVAGGAGNGIDGRALYLTDLVAHAPFSSASTVPDATRTPPRAPSAGPAPAGIAPASRAPASTPPAGAAGPAAGLDRTGLAAAVRLARRYRAAVEQVPVLAQLLDRREHATGSNEWVVSGRHTADGRPVLSNDPHLGLGNPAIFYPVQLTAPGLDAAGEGFAGVPGLAQGQNRWIAWGSTTNPMDVTDTYLEAVQPDSASPSGYVTLYKEQREPVLAVPEVFRANGIGDGQPDTVAVVPPGNGIPPATLVVPRRNNGPIVQLDPTTGAALSVQYVGYSPTQELDAFLQWLDARDLGDFQRGLESFDVGSQNWAYADRAGHIAYFTSGELPLREDLQAGTVAGNPPYLVRNGQGGNEWLPDPRPAPGQASPYRVLPAAEMPHLVDPPAGWFVSANNDPVGSTLDNDPLNQLRPGGGIFYLNPGYDGLRAGRITEALRAQLRRGKVDAADMARIQSDTVLLDAEFFTPRIGAALLRGAVSRVPELRSLARDPRVAEAVARLTLWDRSTPTGIPEGYDTADLAGRPGAPSTREQAASVAATLYAVWRSRFIASTVDAVAARLGAPPVGGQRALTALKRALSGAPSASGVDFFAAPGIADPADRQALAILRAVRTGLDRLASADFAPAFGGSTRVADYRWGRLHRLTLASPLGGPFSAPPAFGRFPAPLPGLSGVPVDGGYGTVDAAAHNPRADSANGFTFGSGPARRYVGVLSPGGPVGRSALPGGTSALPTDRHYLDLLPAYLTDDSYPVRVQPADVAAATETVLVLTP
ncbi:MAG: penicillin acylase family protein [Mycobacteriales bacterium]